MAFFLLGVGFVATLLAVAKDIFGKLSGLFSGLAVILAVCAFGASIKLELDAQASAKQDKRQLAQLVASTEQAATERRQESTEQAAERESQTAVREEFLRQKKLDACAEIFEAVWAFHSGAEAIRKRHQFVMEGYTWNKVLSDRYHTAIEHGLSEEVALYGGFNRAIPSILSPELFQYYNAVPPSGVQSVINRTNEVLNLMGEKGCAIQWGGSNTGSKVVLK